MDLRKKLTIISLIFGIRIRKRIRRNKIKKILLLRYDRIGDMVVTTPLIRELTKRGYEVSTISQKDSIDFISKNPYIKNTYIWNRDNKSMFKNAMSIRKYKYDLAIDMREQLEVKTFLFSLITGAKYLAGFNKANIRKFDHSISYNHPNNHITMKMDAILKELFDIYNADLHYDAFIDDETENNAISFISDINKLNGKVVVINPFASLRERDMSIEQLTHVINEIKKEYTDACIILIGNECLLNNLPEVGAHIFHSKSILDVLPVIKHSDLVLTVDTAALHLAGAYDRKIVGLYGIFNWDEYTQWLKWDIFNSKALPDNFDIKNYLHNNEHSFGIKSLNVSESLHSEKGTLINTIPKDKIAESVLRILKS